MTESGKTEDKLSLDEVLASGWAHTKQGFFAYMGVMAVTGLFAMVPSVIAFCLGTSFGFSLTNITMSLALGFAGFLLASLIELGMINVQLRILDGLPVKSDDVFRTAPHLWKYVAAGILYRFACAFGYLCFIIPGIIVHISFQFYGYFIIDQRMGPIQALRASWELVDGARWQLVLFGFVQYFINMIGLMCFLLGSIPAYMMCSLSTASAYRQMLPRTPALAICGRSDAIQVGAKPALQDVGSGQLQGGEV